MVATQSAGGRGNTWVNANLVVYFSNNHDLELRMQSEDRSHRDGLLHAVTYIDLVAPRTVDEKILKSLRKKLNMATIISGENYREWLI
jgi:SNF2 family DNA or RNA helicase